MFAVFLRFAANKAKAGALMAAHNAWVAKGLADGIFQLVGSLEAQGGGLILAHGEDRPALETRIAQDPFVAEGVVTAQIIGFSPNRADPRLAFLLA
ncbi:MAG: YciI family protein [Proteobacteria bacterium]|nr:YciI family protein [Pseudomonadota bacterium]